MPRTESLKCPPLIPCCCPGASRLKRPQSEGTSDLLVLVPTRPSRFAVIFLSRGLQYADHKPETARFIFAEAKYDTT